MIKSMFKHTNKLEKMTRNVQEIILLLFSITILSNCDEWTCELNGPKDKWEGTMDACCRPFPPGVIKSWLPHPGSNPSEGLYEICDKKQGVPVYFQLKEDGNMLIAAIFSNPGNTTFEKVHLYGNAHQFFGIRKVEQYFNVDSKMEKNAMGCLVYSLLSTKTWLCGENGLVREGYFPESLISNKTHGGCDYTSGNGMFIRDDEKNEFNGQKIYRKTLITSELEIFRTYHIFLSDVYIIGPIKDPHEFSCIKDIRKIGGRLFILNVESEYEYNFEDLEEIGENVQYGKRPIIQVVGNKIPAISFPNLKKIHCEFSTDVCVVYANNNISKFAGVYYEKVPKSDGASYVGQAQILLPPQKVIVIVVHENSHTKEMLIGFVVVLMLVITICSFWMGIKDNDYPANF